MANFWKYTGTQERVYPTYQLDAVPGYVYDFGAGTVPNDGRWTSDPGPATAPPPPVLPNVTPVGPQAGQVPVWDTASASYKPGSLSSLYEPVGAALGPLRAGAIGDSTTAGFQNAPDGTQVAVGATYTYPIDAIGQSQAGAQSWFVWACLLSAGRMLNVYNGAIGGAKTSDMQAALTTALTKGLDVLFLGDVRNDINQAVPEATYRANIDSFVKQTRAAGVRPILRTIYPDDAGSPAGANRTAILRHNAWLRDYARRNHLPVVDTYAAVVDPASTVGAWVAANTADGTHPSIVGAQLAGQKTLDDLDGIIRGNVSPMRAHYLPQDRTTTLNLLANPLFQDDVNADGGADYWTPPNGATRSVITDAGVIGKVQRYVFSNIASSVNAMQSVTVDGTNVSVGDRLAISGMVRTSGASTLNWRLGIGSIGGPGEVRPLGTQLVNANDLPWTPFYCQFIVPTGATSVRFRYQFDAGSGTVDLAQHSVVNLSKIGTP